MPSPIATYRLGMNNKRSCVGWCPLAVLQSALVAACTRARCSSTFELRKSSIILTDTSNEQAHLPTYHRCLGSETARDIFRPYDNPFFFLFDGDTVTSESKGLKMAHAALRNLLLLVSGHPIGCPPGRLAGFADSGLRIPTRSLTQSSYFPIISC